MDRRPRLSPVAARSVPAFAAGLPNTYAATYRLSYLVPRRDISVSAAPYFDQRPGDLEATRPDPALVVVGSRAGDRGWLVLALATHEGALIQLQLTPEQADKAAADLVQMARVCRGEHEVQQRRRAEREAGR